MFAVFFARFTYFWNMFKKQDRQNIILKEVSIHNRVLLKDLAQMLNVSNDTVRRDVIELDKNGLLKKVHGGAVANGYKIYSSNSSNNVYAAAKKAIIAQKAVQLIDSDSIILISGGTTNLELVRHLPEDLRATFFTPSLPIAIELLNHPNIDVIFIGGKLSREAQISYGGSAINTLKEIKVDLCFLGTGYLDAMHGLTEFDWEVVQMKKAMISASRKIISLTISEKLNSTHRYKIGDINIIDVLITELEHNAEILKPYADQLTSII